MTVFFLYPGLLVAMLKCELSSQAQETTPSQGIHTTLKGHFLWPLGLRAGRSLQSSRHSHTRNSPMWKVPPQETIEFRFLGRSHFIWSLTREHFFSDPWDNMVLAFSWLWVRESSWVIINRYHNAFTLFQVPGIPAWDVELEPSAISISASVRWLALSCVTVSNSE